MYLQCDCVLGADVMAQKAVLYRVTRADRREQGGESVLALGHMCRAYYTTAVSAKLSRLQHTSVRC